jgi:hypothetical protein
MLICLPLFQLHQPYTYPVGVCMQVRALLERELTGAGAGSTGKVQVDVGSNWSLSSALTAACVAASRRDAAAAQLLKSLATRAMSEAKYFSTGGGKRQGRAGAGRCRRDRCVPTVHDHTHPCLVM